MRIITDQKTIGDSVRIAETKQKEFLRESKETGDFSRLEIAIALILGAMAIGFVLFVLKNHL
ncbi:hypothetical protein E3E23_08805 [Thermococcus sp. CX2]|uniref:hypothetical protein n=1 Tax=Thermococcus sp. CX2 TaxID=163006 RepID=UPI00143A3AEB|nr:hypothetical protein [Thermococcus sp. CX2]NJE85920.1 hypothetical protein [Thermococcus sp. CX2]